MISACLLLSIAQSGAAAASAESFPNVLDYIMNGGIAAVVFVIWWLTFRYMIKQHETVINDYKDLVKETKKEYQELVKRSNDNQTLIVDRFIGVTKESMTLNNYVIGAIKEMIGKLDQVLNSRRINNDGK